MPKLFLSQLDWRFATKKFDRKKPVTKKDLLQILKAIQYAPSSFGIQPYHVYVVSNRNLQKQIKLWSWLQSQVSDCQYLLVFCARTDLHHRVTQYVNLQAGEHFLDRFKKLALEKGTQAAMQVNFHDHQAKLAWAAKQTYIALGFAVAACMELEIDCCPLEGFNPHLTAKWLKSPTHLQTVVLLAIGYRESEPKASKIRFPESDLFTFIN